MWQDRFGYTYVEAAALLRIAQAAAKPSTPAQQVNLSPAQARTIYLVRLDGPISTAQKVQIIGNLPTIPESHHGYSDEGSAMFCQVDGKTKMAIESWFAAQEELSFRPLFVPVAKAYKELSSQSLYPTLGKDTSLPQFRPQDAHLLGTIPSFVPTQDQYPVWYFFYGTLASASKLSSLLSLSESETPILYEASVVGGKMKTWGKGKYEALVNGSESNRIKGSAYQVMLKEHEDRLRKYETEAYEVVRCAIEMNGTTVHGCTFRFIGGIC